MNKKLLSLLIIIGLVGTINAGPGKVIACAANKATEALAAGVQQCVQAATGSVAIDPPRASTCLAGWKYDYTGADASTCVACPMATWIAADSPATADTAIRTDDTTCTACGTGLTSPVKSTSIAACVKCAAGNALLTTTGGCIPYATTATGYKEGGRVFTTGADPATTIVLVSCDSENGYQSAPAEGACLPCTARATGCGTCEAAVGTCTACRVGFRNTAAAGAAVVCGTCTGECAECNNTGGTDAAPAEKCIKAKDGYYLTTTFVITKCPDNATKCEWDAALTPPAVRVTAVAAGYFIKTGFLSVATACPEGKSSAANSATASDGVAVCSISCASNCLSCVTALAGKCDQCQDDYYIADTAQADPTKYCVKFEEATRPATCQTATANDANSCTSCSGDVQFRERDPTAPTADTKFKCTCMAGYTDISNVAAPATKSPICKKCGTGVKNCDAGQTIVCTNAAEQVAGENCAATTAAVQGFFFDTATTAFKACDSTCLTCAGGDATKCVTCAQITVDTTQLTEQDVKTLSAAWTNGTYTATAPGTCYAKCPEGYQTDPAVRTACEMGSFGNILSAIVLISFIILMF